MDGTARMSKDAQQRIIRAVEDVSALVSGGDSPNSAIIKVARAEGLPPGHIQLVATAYNIGRSACQRSNHDDPLDKAASFPLAETASILEELYPSTWKTAAAVVQETTVSDDYAAAPHWHRERQKAAAYAALPALEKRAAAPRSPSVDKVLKQAFKAANDRQKVMDAARRTVRHSQDQLADGIRKLSAYFRQSTSVPLTDVRESADTLYGRVALRVLDCVAEQYPTATKRASAGRWHAVDAEAMPYSELRRCVQLARDIVDQDAAYVKAASAAYDETRAELDPLLNASSRARSGYLLTGLVPESQHVTDLVKAAVSPLTAVLGADALRNAVSTLGANLPSQDRLVSRQMANLSSPDHEQRLQDIHTTSLLHDLMNSDSLSKSHSPDEVAQAYNDLSQLAPRSAQQPLLAKAILGKQLSQGGNDPFELEQIVSTENRLRDGSSQPPQQPPQGGSDARR